MSFSVTDNPIDVLTYVLDCPDPRALAEFYGRLLGWRIDDTDSPDGAQPDGAEAGWVDLVHPAGRGTLAFQPDPEFRAPTWPDRSRPQMAHIDIRVADLRAAHEHAVAVGARLLDDSHETFLVYADPAGHPFCLCAC